jgi:RHS repeat-associated protein
MKLPASPTSIVADSACRGVLRIPDQASGSQYWKSLMQKHVSSFISNGRRAMLAVLLLAFALAPRAFAQEVDTHNPIGVTGIFNGNVTTGCSYDPLSHSAHRAIDDIVVPGSIGKYSLKMTRYYNSRHFLSSSMGPGWSYEYYWGLSTNGSRLTYPNGNVLDKWCQQPVGISDWWQTLTCDQNGCDGDFRLADGGTVHFVNGRVTAIDDPYGQTTTIVHTANTMTVTEPGGRYLLFKYDGPQSRLSRVEAHALGNATITDWVNYHYDLVSPGGNGTSLYCLTRVDYSDSNPNNLGDNTHAHYTYTEDNVQAQWKVLPLLFTASDNRYKGPMRQIAYDYQGYPTPHGAIAAERFSAGGTLVSRISPGATSCTSFACQMETEFTETRGDGPTHTFHYTDLNYHSIPGEPECPEVRYPQPPSQFLESYTDFRGNTTTLGYDKGTNNEKWYVNSVTANNHTTTYTRGPAPPSGIGQITQITYPDSTHTDYGYYPEPGVSGHYLTSIANYDSANHLQGQTIHHRDANTHKITQTDYKDGDGITVLARETFTYCDQADANQCGPVNPTTGQMHGQIKTHKLKNGAYVHYRYDPQGRGLLIDKWEPTWTATASDSDPKTHYDYYTSGPWTDRVKTVTGPPPNWAYSSQASETHEYDRVLGVNGITDLSGAAVAGRGLVTKITHADGKFQRFAYDAYGNKRWEDDELRKPTSYTYDEYNRPTNVTRPLNGITNYTYNPTNGAGSRLSHTTNNPDTVAVRTSPTASITTRNVYDENFRKISSTAADGTASAATSFFHYDAVGNQDWVTDPRGTVGRTWPNGDPAYTTYTDYDTRDRKWRVREPLARTTQFYYDDGFNITRILRPDQTTETKVYDGMNRLKTDTVPKEQGVNIVTQFQYYPNNVQSGSLLQKVIDGENHNTTFEYDPSGLKTKMTYHDNSYRTWAYDDAHNLKSRTTVNREIQNFAYDNRNRKTGEWWDGFPADGEWRVFDYDDANHLYLATNGTGNPWTNFIADVRRFYDDAGRLTTDRQTVYVNGVPITKDVDYPTYTDDGRVTRMFVNGANPAYDYTFSYDTMGRFEKIQFTDNVFIAQYHYDAASNETQRDNLFNGVLQIYPRDNLNRMQYVDLKKGGNTLGHEGHGYNTMNRLESVTREDNKQDRFTYYKDGELNVATYGANPTPGPSPTPTPTPTPGGQVGTPTFSPDGGVSNQHTINVFIQTATSGAKIMYTINDLVPPSRTHGTLINASSGWVTLSLGHPTLRAMAYKDGMTDSGVHEATYEYDGGGEPNGPGVYPLDMVANPLSQEPIAPEVSTVTYTLDKAGNRLNVNGTSYSPNTINQYTSVGGTPITNGNDHEISDDYYGFHYTYMRDQELIRVASITPGLIYDLAYDALGRCVKRTVNNAITTYYFCDGEKPIMEYNINNAVVGFNVYGKGIDEIIQRGAYGTDNQWHWYFLNQDHEGSVTHLTDTSGNIIERYRYDAFGAPTFYNGSGAQISTTAYGNRFLFTGREYAGALAYEYRARMYSSYLGRFISEDPKLFDAGDYNLFRYCHNDPIDNVDPMGLQGEVYLYRDVADRSSPGTYVITENGKQLYVGRANVNGFMKDDRGNQTRGIPKGDYTLQPKQTDGVYPKGQPAITGREPGLKPGQPTKDYKPDSVLVHEKGAPGQLDSKACVTCDRDAVEKTKEVMDRNLDKGGTKFHVLEPSKRDTNQSGSDSRTQQPDASHVEQRAQEKAPQEQHNPSRHVPPPESR